MFRSREHNTNPEKQEEQRGRQVSILAQAISKRKRAAETLNLLDVDINLSLTLQADLGISSVRQGGGDTGDKKGIIFLGPSAANNPSTGIESKWEARVELREWRRNLT